MFIFSARIMHWFWVLGIKYCKSSSFMQRSVFFSLVHLITNSIYYSNAMELYLIIIIISLYFQFGHMFLDIFQFNLPLIRKKNFLPYKSLMQQQRQLRINCFHSKHFYNFLINNLHDIFLTSIPFKVVLLKNYFYVFPRYKLLHYIHILLWLPSKEVSTKDFILFLTPYM